MRGLSLKAVADPARISAAYLQKLERGDVGEPSPHILYRVADVLGLSYVRLMRLAGYIVPTGSRKGDESKAGTIGFALSSEAVTEEEAQALAEYLAFLRSRRQ